MARLDERRRSSSPEAPVRSDFSVLPWDPQNKLVLRVFLAVACCVCMSPLTLAQTDVNDVHIQPREVEMLADFLFAKVIGKGPMDHAKCVEYWGSEQDVCNDEFPK